MNKFLVTIALGAAMVSTPLFAQQGAGRGFGQRDQTRAEVQQRADMMFQMIDANHDGTVTKDEAQAALANFGGGGGRAGMMQRMIDRTFASAPSVTQAQFEAMMLARFDAQDLNHDGVVTAAEREQARAAEQAAAGTPTAAPAPVPAPAPAPAPHK